MPCCPESATHEISCAAHHAGMPADGQQWRRGPAPAGQFPCARPAAASRCGSCRPAARASASCRAAPASLAPIAPLMHVPLLEHLVTTKQCHTPPRPCMHPRRSVGHSGGCPSILHCGVHSLKPMRGIVHSVDSCVVILVKGFPTFCLCITLQGCRSISQTKGSYHICTPAVCHAPQKLSVAGLIYLDRLQIHFAELLLLRTRI